MIPQISKIQYDPSVHTLDNLLTQIEEHLRDAEGPLLIGSLGRAAAIGSDQEFISRGEPIEWDGKGKVRDIDLFLP